MRSNPSSPVLDVTDLHRSYGTRAARRTVLAGLTLRVDEGRSVAIVGRSGDGKSTLLRCIGLLDRPDGGTISICGARFDAASGRRRARARSEQIGFVFQNARLLDDLSAEENIDRAFPFGRRVSPRRRRTAVHDLIEEFGIGHVARQPARLLSGGERQRVAIGRALAREPVLVLADEPTGSLDTTTGTAAIDRLLARVRGHGISLVVVTHDRAVAARMDDRLLLADGVATPLDPPR